MLDPGLRTVSSSSPLLEAALTDPDHLRVSAVRVLSREDYRPDSPRELFVALRVASRLADGPGARWRAVERLRTIKRIYPDAARAGLVIYPNAAISSVVSDPVLTGPGDYASVCAELTEVDFAGSTKPVAEQVVAAGAALFPDVKGWTASVARINKILDETSISDRSVVESRRGPRRHDPVRDDWASFYRAYSRLFCEHVLARNSHANFLELAKQGWYRLPAEKASQGVKARARTARQTLNTSYGRLYRAASDDSALRRDHLRSVQAVLHQDALSAEAASSGAPGADPLDRANVAFHLIKHTNSAVDPARYEFDSVYRASLEDIWEILEVLAQERARERAGSTTVADQSSGEQRNFAELVDEVQKALKATPR